jgi:hypothetical protein
VSEIGLKEKPKEVLCYFQYSGEEPTQSAVFLLSQQLQPRAAIMQPLKACAIPTNPST